MAGKVLFVDDENDWREVATTYLQGFGFEVITAGNQKEALLKSEGVKLKVIILDVNLAGENGVVLMKFLKRNHPAVPVILYTGMDHDADTIQGMMNEGAHQYLRKGAMEDLLRAVRSAEQAGERHGR